RPLPASARSQGAPARRRPATASPRNRRLTIATRTLPDGRGPSRRLGDTFPPVKAAVMATPAGRTEWIVGFSGPDSVTHFPLTLCLSPVGRGNARRRQYPSPRGEREGPAAQRPEGEGVHHAIAKIGTGS